MASGTSKLREQHRTPPSSCGSPASGLRTNNGIADGLTVNSKQLTRGQLWPREGDAYRMTMNSGYAQRRQRNARWFEFSRFQLISGVAAETFLPPMGGVTWRNLRRCWRESWTLL